MKKISLFVAGLVMVGATMANAYTTVGFKGYSTATPGMACTYVAGSNVADGSFIPVVMAFFNLGTKGLAQTFTPTTWDYKISCFKKSDGSATPAKIFFDNYSTTAYFTTSTFTLRNK
jgi:hypothetical protein